MFSILDRLFPRKKVGLALSGGVARGFAHLGVIKVLKQNKIPIDYISATSSGAILGAFLAAGLDPKFMQEEICEKIAHSHIFKISFGVLSADSGVEIERMVTDYIGEKEFKDLEIPLNVVTQDMKSGEEVVLGEGSVAKAVRATSTFPGFFRPVQVRDKYLMDGAIVNNLPVDVARRMGANFVIGVDVVPGGVISSVPDNGFMQVGRAIDLAMHKMSQKGRDEADVLIEPHIDEDIWQLDVGKYERLIKAGEDAAGAKVNFIKKALRI